MDSSANKYEHFKRSMGDIHLFSHRLILTRVTDVLEHIPAVSGQ